MTLGGDDYRQGALERLADARVLLEAEHFAGAVSNGGRAVEGILRAVIWKRDLVARKGGGSLETGHDLRLLLTHVRGLGLISSEGRSNIRLETLIQRVGRLWFNNARFASSRFIERRWRQIGEVHRARSFKLAVRDFYYDCEVVVKRCEALCQN